MENLNLWLEFLIHRTTMAWIWETAVQYIPADQGHLNQCPLGENWCGRSNSKLSALHLLMGAGVGKPLWERRFGPAHHRPASRLVAPCPWTGPCKVLLEVNQRRKQSWNPRGSKLWAQTRDRVLAVLSHTGPYTHPRVPRAGGKCQGSRASQACLWSEQRGSRFRR